MSTPITEQEYYDEQMVSAAPIQFLGTFVAVIMAVGSCFAAMNTMYASCGAAGARSGNIARPRFLARRHPTQLLRGIAAAVRYRRLHRMLCWSCR